MIDIREHGGIFSGGSGGTKIKNIQRVTAEMRGQDKLMYVTIEPVNVDNSVAIVEWYTDSTRAYDESIVPEIVSSTSLKVFRAETAYSASSRVEVDILIIEFEKIKSRQSGNIYRGGGGTDQMTIDFEPVNFEKSILIYHHAVDSGTSHSDMSKQRYRILSNSSIEFDIASYYFIYWHLIEFE